VSVVSTHELLNPARLPRARLSTRSKDQLNRWTPVDQGACAGLAAFACPEHLCRAREDHPPRSRSVSFSFAGHLASLPPCGVPRTLCQSCLELVSTTDVHVTSTRENIPFGDCPPSALGNPKAFDIETALGHRLSPIASCGAGPPYGHPTSNSSALDGATTGFGPFDSLLPTVRPDVPRLSRGRGSAPALSAEGASVESNPLTPHSAD
jgi:hypothetical protein